jgi:hypothetical protein
VNFFCFLCCIFHKYFNCEVNVHVFRMYETNWVHGAESFLRSEQSQVKKFPMFYETQRFCVHKSPLLVPLLSHLNLDCTLPPFLLKIHFNIILPSMPKSSKWSLAFRLMSVVFKKRLRNMMYYTLFTWWPFLKDQLLCISLAIGNKMDITFDIWVLAVVDLCSVLEGWHSGYQEVHNNDYMQRN